jgi:chromate transporter
MTGIATAAVGMIFRLGMTSAKGSLWHVPSVLVLVATFVAIGVMQWPLVPVLAVLAPLSIAAAWPRKDADRDASAT